MSILKVVSFSVKVHYNGDGSQVICLKCVEVVSSVEGASDSLVESSCPLDHFFVGHCTISNLLVVEYKEGDGNFYNIGSFVFGYNYLS